MDVFSQPADIYLIAKFTRVPASDLFERTSYRDHFARAVFDERWPMFKDHVEVSYDVAWQRIRDNVEFRAQSPARLIPS